MVSGVAMKHLYKIGERVRLRRQQFASAHKDAEYQITQLLPSNGRHNQYRVRSVTGFEERVVTEVELRDA